MAPIKMWKSYIMLNNKSFNHLELMVITISEHGIFGTFLDVFDSKSILI